jgi:hypothetical protein
MCRSVWWYLLAFQDMRRKEYERERKRRYRESRAKSPVPCNGPRHIKTGEVGGGDAR